jgi:hypothetical protein
VLYKGDTFIAGSDRIASKIDATIKAYKQLNPADAQVLGLGNAAMDEPPLTMDAAVLDPQIYAMALTRGTLIMFPLGTMLNPIKRMRLKKYQRLVRYIILGQTRQAERIVWTDDREIYGPELRIIQTDAVHRIFPCSDLGERVCAMLMEWFTAEPDIEVLVPPSS